MVVDGQFGGVVRCINALKLRSTTSPPADVCACVVRVRHQ